MQLVEIVFPLLLGIVIGLAYRPARVAWREHFTVVSIEIVGAAMTQVVEGGTFAFTVVAKNAAGRVVPDKGITVAVDANGSATVADDGSAGVFTAGTVDGVANITATDGTLTSAPFPVTIAADNTPASLEVVAS